jgi:hypothetical protein
MPGDDAASQLRDYTGIEKTHPDVENKSKKGDPVDTGEPKGSEPNPDTTGVKPTATGDRIDEKKAERGEKKAAQKTAAKKQAKKAAKKATKK